MSGDEQNQDVLQQQLKGKKLSGEKLKRYDSLDLESSRVPDAKKALEWSVILKLAFQSIGVVYGDIGTSPLYVFSTIFPNGVKYEEDILGALSLIFYTITLIPVVKYVFIVLQANDNGDGGTFALYSLICRYSKVGLIPSTQAEDKDVSTFKLDIPDRRTRRASKLKSILESSNFAKFFLLFATMFGTSMVIGDGVLTPCVSVLSAIGGVKAAAPSVMTEGRIVWLAVAILILLFFLQRFGTEKVGYTFAPILCLWFYSIAGIGIYNFVKYDPTVIRALNPKYIIDYFKRNKKDAWISLGGVVMCITGGEALFADVGHFSVRSVQISMCCVTYPALILAYLGQTAYLRKHSDDVTDTFYKNLPHSLYWPVFGVAVLAAIIASQALISGTFAIIQQSLALGCFPRVKIVHTSKKYHGQIYIPEINTLLMLACVVVTLAFRTTEKLSNAYGIAVVFVMLLTSCFLVLVMIMIWKTHIIFVIVYILVFGTIELVYLSSVLYKFDQGGYLPLAFAMVLMFIMYVWNYVYRKKYHFELEHKISPEKVQETVDETNYHRLPGLAIFYSELVHGIPPIFKHYVENVPALHSVLVFASVKSLPISKVPVEERFLFRRVKPYDLYVFRCVVRYGYNDVRNEAEPFERLLVERLKQFIQDDCKILIAANANRVSTDESIELENDGSNIDCDKQAEDATLLMERDIEVLERAYSVGVVHLVGEQDVIAGKGSNIAKRVVIDYAFNLLKRNLRQSNKVLDIPHKRMLKVGMIYEI
ncbi:PREDICTED: potassium transporter 5-like [Nicotiana attenuata]|uniref:Potassium transporter n=1 Tax=Nicotiana attenuata TaxID=49451 RepID=A0A314L3L0_NICAT|nr:PREDICTED: potassium transporter 5-like [Nicotiana attenuata]OIT36238.1 potassium transporter 5 [Nicotiana attenuata]